MKLHKRYYNADHYDNGDGTYKASIKNKWINYYDENDEWKPIDITFDDTGDNFEVTNAPFIVEIPKLSTGTAKFISNNRWDITEKQKIGEKPLSLSILPKGIEEVAGVIETSDFGFGETTYVIYPNAYPSLNAELIYWIDNKVSLRKLVKFNYPYPSFTQDVELEFELTFSEDVQTSNKEIVWNSKTELKTKDKFVYKPISALDSKRVITMDKFFAWSDAENPQEIEVKYKKQGKSYLLTKIVTKDLLNSATDDVYTDASFTPSGAVDGLVLLIHEGYSWAQIHDTLTGTSASPTGSIANVELASHASSNNLWLRLGRGFFLFDASSISGETVTAADLKLFVSNYGIYDEFNQGMDIVSSNPASDNTLGIADYDTLGTTVYSTTDLTSMTENATNTFSLNATGVTFVQTALDDDGIVKFGARLTSDTIDTSPTWAANTVVSVSFQTIEHSNDPTLDVTYSLGTGFFNLF